MNQTLTLPQSLKRSWRLCHEKSDEDQAKWLGSTRYLFPPSGCMTGWDFWSPAILIKTAGYRYYSIYQKARLDMIQYMKELGMSLGEIKTILEQGDIRWSNPPWSGRKNRFGANRRELETRLGAITRAIESTDGSGKLPIREDHGGIYPPSENLCDAHRC